MARALDAAGISRYCVLEQADAVGGTWRDNSYPGAACDVPGAIYSLSSVAPPAYRQFYAQQPEIREHLETLAQPLQSSARICLGWRLIEARWHADTSVWHLQAADGRSFRARTLVMAIGGLHVPALPQLPGRGSFAGVQFHSARWRHDIDLRGRKVAVLGSGASAIQIVPAIAEQVAQLSVFQRTPAWVLPRFDPPMPARLTRVLQSAPWLQKALNGSLHLAMEFGASALLYPRSAFWLRAIARRHLRKQIAAAPLRQVLTPNYPIGCKRVLISSDFYPTLTRPNVELIATPIAGLEAAGVRLACGRLVESDVLIYATGFAPLALLDQVDIYGRAGHQLKQDWQQRAQAYLGMSVHGYPNLHFLLGPNTALGHNSVLYMIEQQVNYIIRTLGVLSARAARSLEPTAAAQAEFVRVVDLGFAGSAWAGCNSWYRNANGDNIALWTASSYAYRRALQRLHLADYLFA